MGAYSKNPFALTALAIWLACQLPGAVQAAEFISVENSMDAGIMARDAGQFVEAEGHFRQVLENDPTNTDAALLLALVVAYQERYGEALDILAPALVRAPMRNDLAIAQARILAWSGERAQARDIVATVIEREPDNADALAFDAWLDFTVNDKARPFTVYFSGSRSDFERSTLDPWYEGLAGISYRMDEHWILGGEFRKSRRYGLDDENITARAAYRFDRTKGVNVAAEVTPGADFLPKWGLSAGADIQVSPGLKNGWIGPSVLTLDARHRRYQTVKVNSLDPGVVQYFADGQAWLSLKKIHVWDSAVDSVDHGWSIKLDVDFAALAPVRVYVLRADSPENDLGVPVKTQTVAGGAIYDVTDRFGFRVDYTHDDRSGSFQREEVSLGTFFKF